MLLDNQHNFFHFALNFLGSNIWFLLFFNNCVIYLYFYMSKIELRFTSWSLAYISSPLSGSFLPLNLCISILKKYSYTFSVSCPVNVRLRHGEGWCLRTESPSLLSASPGKPAVQLSLLHSAWTFIPRLFDTQVFTELPLHTWAKILIVQFKRGYMEEHKR